MLKISYNLESNTKFGFSRGTFIIYTVVADVLLFLRQFRSPKTKGRTQEEIQFTFGYILMGKRIVSMSWFRSKCC